MTPDDLGRLEALAAAATPGPWEVYGGIDGEVAGVKTLGGRVIVRSFTQSRNAAYIAALWPSVVSELIAAARLGAAWQAAEAALPEYWRIRSLIELPGPLVEWEIVAAGEQRIVRASGPTPAAALLSLAEALRGRL